MINDRAVFDALTVDAKSREKTKVACGALQKAIEQQDQVIVNMLLIGNPQLTNHAIKIALHSSQFNSHQMVEWFGYEWWRTYTVSTKNIKLLHNKITPHERLSFLKKNSDVLEQLKIDDLITILTLTISSKGHVAFINLLPHTIVALLEHNIHKKNNLLNKYLIATPDIYPNSKSKKCIPIIESIMRAQNEEMLKALLLKEYVNPNARITFKKLETQGPGLTFAHVDPEYCKMDNVPPIFRAIHLEYAVAVQLLLDIGADPNLLHSFYTPLSYAVHRGNLEIVAILLKHALIDVNKNAESGRTALEIACTRNDLAIVKALLEMPGIDIHKRNPLKIAIARNYHEIVDYVRHRKQELLNDDDVRLLQLKKF